MSLLLITYIASTVMLIVSLFMERKISVLDLLIALVILAIPFFNVVAFLVNFVMMLDSRGIISLRGIGENVVNFLNKRIGRFVRSKSGGSSQTLY